MEAVTRLVVEAIAALIMVGGLVGVLIERFRSKRGIGVRVIQFLAIVFIIPTIVILALEKVLNTETTAALLGVIVGYVLSGIGKDEANKGG